MLLIPKHIHTFIATIESELHKKNSNSARFYLSDIQEIKRAILGLSYADYSHIQLRIMLLHIQRIINIAKDAEIYAGIPKVGKFTHEVLVDERLIHLLNRLNMENNDLKPSALAVSKFITSVPNNLEPELANCDYREFRLITTKENWMKAKSLPGLEVNLKDTNGKPNKIKIFFTLQKNFHTVYPKQAFEDIKDRYQNNTGCYDQDDFGTIKEAFDMWFHVGNKGTYYIYVE